MKCGVMKRFLVWTLLLGGLFCILPNFSNASQDDGIIIKNEKFIELSSTLVDRNEKKAKALASYTLGVMYDLQGLTSQAIEEFEKAINYDESYAIHLRLGADYARIGNLDAAVEKLNKVIEYDSNNVQARYLLALIYSTQKEFDKAAKEYESILTSFAKAEPENIEIYGYLSQLYYSQKEYDKAIEQLEIILSFTPDNTDLIFLLGSLYLELDKKDEAVDLFEKAIKIDPEHDSSLNSLGYVYAEDGVKLEEAQALIEKAVAMDPENGAYLDSLGWVYFRKGEYLQALELLKKADNLLRDAVIYEHLGDVYHKLNKTQEAEKYWKLSLEMEPDQDHIIEKINSLKNL